MSNKETIKKIEELEKQLKELKNELNNNENEDSVYLLSDEEYEKYRNKIDLNGFSFWLSSAYNGNSRYVCCVSGCSGYLCHDDCHCFLAVRPALNLSLANKDSIKYVSEDTIVFCGISWTKLDEDVYFADYPIMCTRFDVKSNDYMKSDVREKLLDWYGNRKDM